MAEHFPGPHSRLNSGFYFYINYFRKLIEDVIGIAVYCCISSDVFFLYGAVKKK